MSYCPSGDCTKNNGNIWSITQGTATIAPNLTQAFNYDKLNRLLSITEGGSANTWDYDNRGNRWATANSPNTVPPLFQQSAFLPNSSGQYNNLNQSVMSNEAHADRGNQTAIGTYTFKYDGESRMALSVNSGTVTYSYDGDGRRVQKQNGTAITTYVYDAFGNLAAEYGGAAAPQPCTTCYVTVDHLGSTRVLTDSSGAVKERHDYMPFGDQLFSGVSGRTAAQGYLANTAAAQSAVMFTGQYRDSDLVSSAMPDGLDYFRARYFSGAQGRFTSPDPVQIIKEKLVDPQQWNMYAYVRNNPLSSVDPDGEACTALYGNSGSGFCTRATEYGKIDAISAVRSQTRFFAAANAVSQALADVATPISGLLVSGQTASFLEGVGQRLEKLNQTESSEIQMGSLSGPNLDQQLVHNEQSTVQDQLNGLRQSDPAAYSKTIGDINGALNGSVTKGLEQLSGTDRAYAGVLAGVRKDLGRNIDFSKQGDREAIGNALIKHIRQTGGCDVNGDKQPGCK